MAVAPTSGSESVTAERCSVASEGRGEPLAGTASTVRSWLLLEHPGPWGRDALVDARHGTAGFGTALGRRCRATGVRPLLIRRVGRTDPIGRPVCFAVSSPAARIERIVLGSHDEALDLDLDALGQGEPLGLELHPGTVFLVCTHGRHDVCCAERGRPLASALGAVLPEQTWEASHIGGDRFAGNVLALPHGVYFGRVAPADAEAVAMAYLAGRLSLRHLRGRSTQPMAVQFAEHALRVELGLDGIDEVAVEGSTRVDATTLRTSVHTPRGAFVVTVSVGTSAPQRLTCRSDHAEGAPSYRLTAIEPA